MKLRLNQMKTAAALLMLFHAALIPASRVDAADPADEKATPKVRNAIRISGEFPANLSGFDIQWRQASLLLQELIKQQPEANILIAPNSLGRCMRAVSIGSAGNTQNQIEKVFSRDLDRVPDRVFASETVYRTVFEPGFKVNTNSGYGLIVSRLNTGSDAAKQGLAMNDLILSVDRTPVRTAREFQEILDRSMPKSIDCEYFQFRTGEVKRIRFEIQAEKVAEGPQMMEQRYIVFQKDLEVDRAYATKARINFRGRLLRFDFRSAMQQTLVDWENKPVLNSGDLFPTLSQSDPDTRMVIFSKLDMKKEWMTPFSKKGDLNFVRTNGEVTPVPSFGSSGSTTAGYYLDTEHYEMAKLMFKDNSLSMTFILPKSNIRPDNLHLFDESLARNFKRMASTDLLVQIPSFKFESKLNLKPVLEQLGITDAFNEKADLKPIAPGSDLKLRSVQQETMIDCSEAGVSASAKTTIVASSRASVKGQEFHLNRPFLFLISDQVTGEIHFAGKVEKP